MTLFLAASCDGVSYMSNEHVVLEDIPQDSLASMAGAQPTLTTNQDTQ
jgi:hypothetical protein